MIGVAVGDDHRRELRHPLLAQEWKHDTSTSIKASYARSTIDQHPAISWGANGNRVTLADR